MRRRRAILVLITGIVVLALGSLAAAGPGRVDRLGGRVAPAGPGGVDALNILPEYD